MVIPEETWPDKPEFAERKALGSYDGLNRFGSDTQAWARATAARLESWGFNTAGAWSSEELYQQPIYHARVVWFSQDGKDQDRLIDVFTPEYAGAIERVAVRDVAPYRNDSWLIGYFLNNELPWYGTHGWPEDPNNSLFDRYLRLPVNSTGPGGAVALSPPTVREHRRFESRLEYDRWYLGRIGETNGLVAQKSHGQAPEKRMGRAGRELLFLPVRGCRPST